MKMWNSPKGGIATKQRRGRPARDASDQIRTTAWYHFLAGESTASQMASWPQFMDCDLATIYRYRRGECSPGERHLNLPDDVFIAARAVYEIGPFQVPLWDSMWGSTTPADVALAGRVMPGGDWNSSRISEMLFDDVVLARLMTFREMTSRGRTDSVTTDLETLAAAIRVCRAYRLLNHGCASQLRLLLETSCALPGARGLLERVGCLTFVRRWIADQFGTDDSTSEPVYRAAWMQDDELFHKLCQQAEERRLAVRNHLLDGGGFRPDLEEERSDTAANFLH